MNKKLVSLLSDGFDSPVAAYLMMKRGFKPIFLTFITTNQQNKEMITKIEKILKKLSNFADQELKLYLISHTSNLEIFKTKCSRKLTCILCKRVMLRIAAKLAAEEETNIILTGDILGEQASQTLSNLYSYNNVLDKNIKLTPLIGLNKLDIINLNKKIGLYQICSDKISSCNYYPQYPETNVKKNDIKRAEKKLNLSKMIKKSIEKAKILKF